MYSYTGEVLFFKKHTLWNNSLTHIHIENSFDNTMIYVEWSNRISKGDIIAWPKRIFVVSNLYTSAPPIPPEFKSQTRHSRFLLRRSGLTCLCLVRIYYSFLLLYFCSSSFPFQGHLKLPCWALLLVLESPLARNAKYQTRAIAVIKLNHFGSYLSWVRLIYHKITSTNSPRDQRTFSVNQANDPLTALVHMDSKLSCPIEIHMWL